jgi:hypothetical protein
LAPSSSPAIGRALRSASPAGRARVASWLAPMLLNAFTRRAPTRWRWTSSLVASSSLSSSGICPSRPG